MIHWREIGTLGRIEAIRSVWVDGCSASQIAATLKGVTRNAVIGMYGRFGKTHLADTPLQSPPRSLSSKARKHRTYTTKPEPIALLVSEPQFSPTEYHLAGKPLMMLEAHECRWPVNDASGDDLHLFCGMQADGSYCSHHHVRANQPIDRR